MLLKENDSLKTILTKFDLFGNDEVALSKAFSYLIASNKGAFRAFIKLIQVRDLNFRNTTIEREVISKEGRTDIELFDDKCLVIVECKIGKNLIKRQTTQYLNKFKNYEKKYMCFITQQRTIPFNYTDVEYRFKTWQEIISCFLDNKSLTNDIDINEFINFVHRRYRMKEDNTILIQDVGDRSTVESFNEFKIYDRPEKGTASYFAPYFIRDAKKKGLVEKEGISYIAKVLGILNIKACDIVKHRQELLNFSSQNEDVVKLWIKGVKRAGTKQRTFYFLDNPLSLFVPLRKDKGIKKGRGRGWIAAYITPNRKVDFISFINNYQEALKDQGFISR